MKKFAAVAAVAVGALSVGAAGTSSAAVKINTQGNFQYSTPQYVCDAGTPVAVMVYRTLNITEAKVTFSAPGYLPYVDTNVKPYNAFDAFETSAAVVGKTVPATIIGSTSGTKIKVTFKVPASCKGLADVKSLTKVDWNSVPKATAKPAPTTPAPSKPAPSKPAPSKPAPSKPAPSKPAPSKAAPAPSNAGPRVETDYVTNNSSNTAGVAVALGGAVLVAGAGTVAVRRRK